MALWEISSGSHDTNYKYKCDLFWLCVLERRGKMTTKKIMASTDVWPPTLCTPLCPKPACPRKGKHSEIILVLARCANIPSKENEFEQCLDRYKTQAWLHKDCVPDKLEELRYPLVHWACMLGKHVALEVLVDNKFDLAVPVRNTQSNAKETALFSMVRHLRLGTNPKLSDAKVAYIFGNIFNVFLSHGSEVVRWQQDKSGDCIFHFCCKQLGSSALAKLYLHEMVQRIKNHRPALSHEDKVEILGVQNQKGNNLIHELVDSPFCTDFKKFSENLENVVEELSKVKNNVNKTPRQLAVEKKSLDLLRALGAPEVVLNSVVNAVSGLQEIRGTPNSRRPAQRARREPQGSPARQRRSGTAGLATTVQSSKAATGKKNAVKESPGKRNDQSPTKRRETSEKMASLPKQSEKENETEVTKETLQGETEDNKDLSEVDMPSDSAVQSVEESVSTTDPKKGTFQVVDDAENFLDLADTVQSVMLQQSGSENKDKQAPTVPVSSTQPKARKTAGGSNVARKSTGGSIQPKRMSSAASTPNSTHGAVGTASSSLAEVSSSNQTSPTHDKPQKRPAPLSTGKGKSKKRRLDDLSDSEDEDADFNLELNDDSDDSLDSPEEEEETADLPTHTDHRGMYFSHTPFCPRSCDVQHHGLLLNLLKCSNHTSGRTSHITAFLEKLDLYLTSFEEPHRHVNYDIPDPVHAFKFPLVHWACVLGKYRLLESLAAREEFDFAVRSRQTGETALHRTLLYLDESWRKVEMQQSGIKRIVQIFSEVLNALTNRKAVIMTCTNAEGDTPFHVLAKAILDCTGRPGRLTCFQGYFDNMLAKLKDLEKRSKLKPGSVQEVLTKENQSQETFFHILACREGLGHTLIKKVLTGLDLQIVQSLKTKVNKNGKTASDIAKELGSLEMAQTLSPSQQERQLMLDHEHIQVKKEPFDEDMEPTEVAMDSLFDYDELLDIDDPVEPQVEDNQSHVSESTLVTSSEGVELGSSLENQEDRNIGEAFPATSSHSGAEGLTAMEHAEDCKQYDLVAGIMSSGHPGVMKISVLETLHRGLQDRFDQGNNELQEKKVGLEKASQVCEELSNRKEALLAQLEEVENEMEKSNQERSTLMTEVLSKEEQCTKYKSDLTRCENALKQLDPNK